MKTDLTCMNYWIDDGTACLIGKVKDPFGIFGNMSNHEIVTPEWGTFARAEMYFQALRFFPGGEAWELLRAEKNPMKAKMIAKAHRQAMIFDPRSALDVENMLHVLRLKHAQHEDVRDALRSTGSRMIIEDCTRRQNDSGLFWGAALHSDGSWDGKNMLGELWMQIRKESE